MLIPTDKDIGYGPPVVGAKGGSSGKAEDQVDFHPPAPPITGNDGSVEAGHDVVRFDSNFYVAKKTDAGDVRQVGGSMIASTQAFLTQTLSHSCGENQAAR